MGTESMEKAVILLEDGRRFAGTPFGARGVRSGELVCNTAMTGYQEVLTDPSGRGQIAAMTYPLIGNCGVNDEDRESPYPQVEGLIVRECCRYPSNWRSSRGLDSYLREHGVVGIEGVDTRALATHIRSRGAQRCVISSAQLDPDLLARELEEASRSEGRDLVAEVTCREPHVWEDAGASPGGRRARRDSGGTARPLRVAVYDCGVKASVMRRLAAMGCEVVLVPAHTPASRVLGMGPDGICVCGGPGDPAAASYVADEVAKLVGVKPILGLGLGQQILALALGGSAFKLKAGHRGANHPVRDLRSGKVLITSQNHGFCVDPDSMRGEAEPTFINLNDGTLEGFRHRRYPAYGLQFHPAVSPAPADGLYPLGDFHGDMLAKRGGSRA